MRSFTSRETKMIFTYNLYYALGLCAKAFALYWFKVNSAGYWIYVACPQIFCPGMHTDMLQCTRKDKNVVVTSTYGTKYSRMDHVKFVADHL